jgi:chemotaxis protein CheD
VIAGVAPTLLVAGIGEMDLATDASTSLVAYGLGSCVALALWDPRTKVGGLAHFMLPSGSAGGPPVKFVESGMGVFLAAFEAHGGSTRRAQIKAAGGAAMLAITASALEIGRRNGEAVTAALRGRGLSIHATDLGGKAGRTVQLEVATGRLQVKSVMKTTEL